MDGGARVSARPAARRRPDSASPLEASRSKTIGRFELIRELARGGMGQVFLGRDTKLGRKVAIKFLLRNDSEFLQRFLVEARATALCTHENIVTIYEVGEHQGLPYMVLEYLEGKTLHDVLHAKPTARQFVELMIPVVRALERAHEHGIVHRDLKPSNIFVTTRGHVKVLDFGIARLIDFSDVDPATATAASEAMPADELDAFAGITAASAVVGTAPYMSPEQWEGSGVDHRTDFWAMGILFWRALAGVHPAGSSVPEKLRARLSDLDAPLPSIAMHDPALPEAVVAIVDRCLAKRKADRYQRASELLADLQAFVAPGIERATDDVSPYRGLATFGEDDATYFFGRSNEIRTALAQLDSTPLLAVVGPSGVGKSSFVHAGLVPALRAAGGIWQVSVLRPGRTPLQRLATALEEALPTGERADDLVDRLHEAPGTFATRLRDSAQRRGTRILVVVDQLEELFTLCERDDERQVFLAALLAAADDPTSPIRVVLSMRADFLDRLANHRQFLGELSLGLFFLSAPDRENLRETLERPAELAGYTFETRDMVDDMLQAATSRGALPLLSFAASRLWEERDREHKLLTAAAYHQMGKVGGAFARHADQVVSAVPSHQQALLRSMLTRLVTADGTRAVVEHAELTALSAEPREVEHILDQLVRARLVHVQTTPDQGTTIELVHEMLISEWPTLRRWLEGSQAARTFVRDLGSAARQWHARGRPHDLVWRGEIAQDAMRRAELVPELAGVEREFLSAIAQQAARGRRRKRFVLAAILGTLALGLGGALFAYMRIDEENQRTLEAKGQLQSKVDALEAEQRARAGAERARAGAEQAKHAEAEKRAQIEKDLASTQQQSREQLEDANRALREEVTKAEEARRKAEAERERATKLSVEATAARDEVKVLLRKEQEARRVAEDELRKAGIATSLRNKDKGESR